MKHLLSLLLVVLLSGNIQSSRFLNLKTSSNPAHPKSPFFIFRDSLQKSLICSACQSGSRFIFNRLDRNEETIVAVIKFFGGIATGDKTMANSMIDQFKKIVVDGIKDKLVNQDFVCGLLLNICDSSITWEDFNQYKKDTLQGKPAIEEPRPTQKSTYTMLQINDMHVDFDYQEGASILCGKEGNCCQRVKGMAKDNADAAGYWGSTGSNCDIPKRTFEAAMDFIASDVKPDYVIWLGDNSDHNIYQTDVKRHNNFTKYMSDYVKKTFPDTRVFPILGNHEMLPIDTYDFYHTKKTDDIVETMSEYFTGLQDKEALEEFKKYGYYSTLIDEEKGRNLRIINTFVASDDVLNLYNINTLFDPENQLKWLQETLSNSEKNKEDVFIIRHIPIGQTINEASNKHLLVLFERYSNIIRGIFAGHSHNDELSYIRDSNKKFVAPHFTGPSLTTFGGGNPSFRVFTIDSDTNVVLDYKQYRLDTEKYNAMKDRTVKLKWDVAYGFQEEYRMKDTSFESFEELDVRRQEMDEEFLQKYHFNYHGGSYYRLKDEKRKYYQCCVYTDLDDWNKCLGKDGISGQTISDISSKYLNIFFGKWVLQKKA